MTDLIFLDTECTSLDPVTGQIWEVAAIKRTADSEEEYHWFLPVSIEDANPVSLEISRYFYRYPQPVFHPGVAGLGGFSSRGEFVEHFAELTAGCHLVGNVVSFDEERIRRMFYKYHTTPGWHYHLIDVENLAAGKLGIEPPYKSDDLAEQLGVEPPSDEDRHTALGDARWAMATYDAVYKQDME